ncbi:MAG: TolC family protein [Epsilonproteobacteria bacterium]|nr:TolC family protein [Campylobacterota bacterium]
MQKISLLLCFLLSFGLAEDIDALIQKAYTHSYTLKAMQTRVEISDESVKNSDSWDNPVLSAGLTDLQLDDISDRSLEPMQTQFISLSQVVPLRGKKQIAKAISEDQALLAKLRIEDQKAVIASQITRFAFEHVINQEQVKLIGKNRYNLIKIKKLFSAYQVPEERRLMVDLKLLTLENRLEDLAYQQMRIKADIEKLTIVPVEDIEASLHFPTSFDVQISAHPRIKLLAQEIKQLQKRSDLAVAKKIPNLKVSGGYYQRDARDDYLNLSFSMPLPVRGIEKVEMSKAKLAILEANARLDAMKQRFEKEVAILQHRMKTSAKNYQSYTKRLVPKQKKITKLIETKNRIATADLSDVMESLNQTILLQSTALQELGRYFKAYAKMRYYR